MARIAFTVYDFRRPNTLTKSDYETIKEVLNQDKTFNINPPSNFFETFKVNLIFLGAGVLGLLLMETGISIITIIAGITAFIGIGSIINFIPSLISFSAFVTDKAVFYSKLKKDIIKSIDYDNFIEIRGNR